MEAIYGENVMAEKREGQDLIRLYLPIELKEDFKLYCSLKGTTMTNVLREHIEELLVSEDFRLLLEKRLNEQRRVVPSLPGTIALLVRENFYKLLADGKIHSENLQAIATGEKPSNPDLVRIAQILNIREEDLLAMRDREFQNQSKRKQPNGHH
jgi:hypothetical protein